MSQILPSLEDLLERQRIWYDTSKTASLEITSGACETDLPKFCLLPLNLEEQGQIKADQEWVERQFDIRLPEPFRSLISLYCFGTFVGDIFSFRHPSGNYINKLIDDNRDNTKDEAAWYELSQTYGPMPKNLFYIGGGDYWMLMDFNTGRICAINDDTGIDERFLIATDFNLFLRGLIWADLEVKSFKASVRAEESLSEEEQAMHYNHHPYYNITHKLFHFMNKIAQAVGVEEKNAFWTYIIK